MEAIFILFSTSRGWINKKKAGAAESLHLGGIDQRCQGVDLLNARDAGGRLKGRRISLDHVNLLGQLQYCKACFPIAQQLKWGLRSRNPKTGTFEDVVVHDATMAREAVCSLRLLAARADAEVAREEAATAKAAQLVLAARADRAERDLNQASVCGLLDARKECLEKESALAAKEKGVAEREERLISEERKLQELRKGGALLEESARRKALDMEDEARRMECRVRGSEKTLHEILVAHRQMRKALLETKREAAEEKRRRDDLMIIESNRLHALEEQREGTAKAVSDLRAQQLGMEGDLQKAGRELADLEAHRQEHKRKWGGDSRQWQPRKSNWSNWWSWDGNSKWNNK